MTESSHAASSLEDVVARIRHGGLLTGLVALFASCSIALVLQASEVALIDLAVLVLAAVVAGSGLVLCRGALRAALVSTGALALVLGVLFATPPAGALWPPIASLAFAMSVVAVCSLPVMPALLMMLVAGLLTYIGATMPEPRTVLISTSLMGGWVTPLSVVSLAGAFLIVLRAWSKAARQADANAAQVRELHREALVAEQVDASQRAVDRQIHETLLNTLSALSGPSSDPASARAQCAADLARLSGSQEGGRLDLPGVVDEALDQVPGLSPAVEPVPAVALPDVRTARVVRDAIIELLRNIERHAQTDVVTIHFTQTLDDLSVRIEDDGRGIGAAQQRFGLRTTVNAAIDSIGGRVEIEDRLPRGTRATLTVPLNRRLDILRPPGALDVLLGSPIARLALSPTLVLGLVAVPFAVVGFRSPWALLAVFALLVAAAAILALGWDRVSRRVMGTVVIALALLTMGIAAPLQDGCTTAVAMHWIIYPAAGSVVLATLAMHTLIARGIVLAIVIGFSVLVSFTTPASCRLDPLDAALENAGWVIVIVVVVSVLSRTVDRFRDREHALWLDTVESQATVAASEAASSRWAAVNASTRDLIDAVARGRIQPGSAQVRRRAQVEEARLRALLDLAGTRSPRLRVDLEGMVESIAYAGSPVQVQVFDLSDESQLAAPLIDRILSLTIPSAPNPIQLTILPSAALITFTPDDSVLDRESITEVLADGRTVVRMDR